MTIARFRSLAIPLAAALCLVARPLAAQDLLLTNVAIVDPDAETVRQGNLLIRDGKIAGFPSEAPAGFRGRVLDLTGKYVIPGLTDMHTHSFGNFSPGGAGMMMGPAGTARADLFVGVARFLDLFSPEDSIFAARERQRSGRTAGAEILAAGPCLTATSGHCSEYGVPTRIVDSPEDARREVTALARKSPDVVKLVYDHASYGGRSMPTVDRATMAAVVATAKQLGLKTVVHVGTWQDVRDATVAGAAAVTHTPFDGPPPDDLGALMVEHGTFHIPTLAVQSDYSRIVDDPTIVDSPLLVAQLGRDALAPYRQPIDSANRLQGWIAWQRRIAPGNLAAVAALAKAGVPMMTGTDAGNPAVFQGYSVHREMRLLADAGLTPWQALAAATTVPGRFLGRGFGMQPGDEGTVVVLDGSPIADIRNTEAIAMVIQRGRVVDRDALRWRR